MKNYLIIFISTFFAFETVLAQPNARPEDIASSLREQRAEQTRTRTEIESLRRSNSTLRRRVGNLDAEIGRELSKCDGITNNRDRKNCQDRAGYRISDLRAEQHRIRRQITSQILQRHRRERSLERLKANIDRLESAQAEQDEADRRKEEFLEQLQELRIDNLNVHTELLSLTDEADNIDDILDDIETAYDKSLLGAYLQDKIGQLLNSHVICRAMRRCRVREPDRIDPEDIQRELFPETQTRSEYYDKVKKRRDEGVR